MSNGKEMCQEKIGEYRKGKKGRPARREGGEKKGEEMRTRGRKEGKMCSEGTEKRTTGE